MFIPVWNCVFRVGHYEQIVYLDVLAPHENVFFLLVMGEEPRGYRHSNYCDETQTNGQPFSDSEAIFFMKIIEL